MDIGTLNREVVLMRKHVKQARVHVIRKLIKNVKLYKNRRGDEAQKNKFMKKADKLLEEILIIKKLKVDKVSKFALSAEELNICNDDTLEIRALKRLAAHKKIATFVKQFRDKYPGWKVMLPVLHPHGKLKKLQSAGKKKNEKVKKEKKNEKCNISIKDVNATLQDDTNEEEMDSFFLMKFNKKENPDSVFCVSDNKNPKTYHKACSPNIKMENLKSSKKGLEPKIPIKEQSHSIHKNMKNYTESDRKDLATAGKIHPSWEAKRRLKEKQLAATFSGKKIKFEDE